MAHNFPESVTDPSAGPPPTYVDSNGVERVAGGLQAPRAVFPPLSSGNEAYRSGEIAADATEEAPEAPAAPEAAPATPAPAEPPAPAPVAQEPSAPALVVAPVVAVGQSEPTQPTPAPTSEV